MSTAPTLSEIDRKLDHVIDRIDKVLDDHEQRIRAMERWIYAVPPTLLIAAGSVVAAIVSG